MACSRTNDLYRKPVRYSPSSCLKSRDSKQIGHHSRRTCDPSLDSPQPPSRSMYRLLQRNLDNFRAQSKRHKLCLERSLRFFHSYVCLDFLLLCFMCNGYSNIARQDLGSRFNHSDTVQRHYRSFDKIRAKKELADYVNRTVHQLHDLTLDLHLWRNSERIGLLDESM